MIAKVAPLARLGKRADLFDYFVPEEMKEKINLGSLVKIPWRTQKIRGIVLAIEKNQQKSAFRTRPVFSLENETPILTKEQLALIKKFSEFYFTTQRSAARLFVPDIPSKISSEKKSQNEKFEFKISKNKIQDLEKSFIELNKKNTKAEIKIKTQDVSSFVWLLLKMQKTEKGQILALFPTIDMVLAFSSAAVKAKIKNFSIIHSNMGKNKFWEEYKKILFKKSKIIFSTRQGVFLPIMRESSIVFFESQSQDFKQYDQNPRYDSREMAKILARETSSRLIFASSSEPFFEKENFFELPSAFQNKTQIKLCDMKNEMSKKDFEIISYSSIEAIEKTIQKKEKVLILSLKEKQEKGVSVDKIFQILTKKLKNCKIAKTMEKGLEFDILITTPRPLEGLKLLSERKKIGLAIFASIEPMLSISDFRTNQRVLERLNFWKAMCQELEIKKIILQSYSPENASIRAFCFGEIQEFKKTESAARKELFYPPYSRLVKIWTNEDKNPADKIKQAIKNLSEKIKIIGPFKDKKGKNSFLIKTEKLKYLYFLKEFSNEWTIDIDPENVL